MSLLLDTSGVLVLLDRAHPLHEAAKGALEGRLLVPGTILPEVDHLARHRLGEKVVRGFLEGLAQGEGLYLPFLAEDLPRALEVMDACPGVGFGEASIVALAEKHRIGKVLTPNGRDFSRFRPRGLGYLELLP
ncbi:type II toxin-antitoxin system VapC family toxin [Thermus sediminis]|uniref:type II toxin-antitoxin system VapC family toxin n=1 Tax=Thermus sediminis TaxID=1761908 RepID=UPI0013001E7A|nr:PIN domain-containing protein [Thermus sediminis]